MSNRKLSAQVDALRTACITHLRECADRIEQVAKPEDPWSAAALRADEMSAPALLAAGERMRGMLATVAGVLDVDPPDTVAMQLAAAAITELTTSTLPEDLQALRLRELEELGPRLRELAHRARGAGRLRREQRLIRAQRIVTSCRNVLADGESAGMTARQSRI